MYQIFCSKLYFSKYVDLGYRFQAGQNGSFYNRAKMEMVKRVKSHPKSIYNA